MPTIAPGFAHWSWPHLQVSPRPDTNLPSPLGVGTAPAYLPVRLADPSAYQLQSGPVAYPGVEHYSRQAGQVQASALPLPLPMQKKRSIPQPSTENGPLNRSVQSSQLPQPVGFFREAFPAQTSGSNSSASSFDAVSNRPVSRFSVPSGFYMPPNNTLMSCTFYMNIPASMTAKPSAPSVQTLPISIPPHPEHASPRRQNPQSSQKQALELELKNVHSSTVVRDHMSSPAVPSAGEEALPDIGARAVASNDGESTEATIDQDYIQNVRGHQPQSEDTRDIKFHESLRHHFLRVDVSSGRCVLHALIGHAIVDTRKAFPEPRNLKRPREENNQHMQILKPVVQRAQPPSKRTIAAPARDKAVVVSSSQK